MISPWKSGDVLYQWIGLRKNKYWNPSSNFRGKKQLVGSFRHPSEKYELVSCSKPPTRQPWFPVLRFVSFAPLGFQAAKWHGVRSRQSDPVQKRPGNDCIGVLEFPPKKKQECFIASAVFVWNHLFCLVLSVTPFMVSLTFIGDPGNKPSQCDVENRTKVHPMAMLTNTHIGKSSCIVYIIS